MSDDIEAKALSEAIERVQRTYHLVDGCCAIPQSGHEHSPDAQDFERIIAAALREVSGRQGERADLPQHDQAPAGYVCGHPDCPCVNYACQPQPPRAEAGKVEGFCAEVEHCVNRGILPTLRATDVVVAAARRCEQAEREHERLRVLLESAELECAQNERFAFGVCDGEAIASTVAEATKRAEQAERRAERLEAFARWALTEAVTVEAQRRARAALAEGGVSITPELTAAVAEVCLKPGGDGNGND